VSIAHVNLRVTEIASASLLLLSLLLSGCATSTVGSSIMDARAEVAVHPKATGYPAVEDIPPRPEKAAMASDEQLKLKKELLATRERQAKFKAKEDAARADPVKP
jgi:hypothetical protein